MTHALYRRSALGMCLVAALGLMAVTATGAQAVEGWLVEGASALDRTPIHAAIHPLKATGKKHIVFLVPAQRLEILCSELFSDDGLLIQNTLLLIKLSLKGCETFSNEKAVPLCNPVGSIDLIFLGHLFLHGELKKSTYILFEPDIWSEFGTIFFNESCALAKTEPVTGSFVAECLNEKLQTNGETGLDNCLQELVHHLIQQAPEKLFEKDVLRIGGSQALIDGIFDFLLSGEKNKGKTWSGHV
jgi:hypothetical protein